MNETPALCLASGSPQRRELLAQLGVNCLVRPMDIDERQYPKEPVRDYVRRLALTKAQTGLDAINGSLPVLGADTVVYLDDEILGKPRDKPDALSMLSRLSGRSHEVFTGVAVVSASTVRTEVVSTTVTFGPLSTNDIERYWQTGEPTGRAGSYAIQGRGAALVSHIEGSYTNVVGLPLYEVAHLLTQVGISQVRSVSGLPAEVGSAPSGPAGVYDGPD